MNTPRPRRGGGIASFSFIFLPVLVFLYSIFLFVTQLPSLERWALLPFGGFPTLTCFLFFLNFYFRNLYNIFVASVGTFSASFLFYFIFLYLILG